jgi:hypothetical protein
MWSPSSLTPNIDLIQGLFDDWLPTILDSRRRTMYRGVVLSSSVMDSSRLRHRPPICSFAIVRMSNIASELGAALLIYWRFALSDVIRGGWSRVWGGLESTERIGTLYKCRAQLTSGVYRSAVGLPQFASPALLGDRTLRSSQYSSGLRVL